MDPSVPRRAAGDDGRDRPRRGLLVAVIAFLLLIAGVGLAVNYYRGCKEPAGGAGVVSFTVPEGATGQEVVAALRERGLIACGGFVGNLLLRDTGKADAILAGTYDLAGSMTLDEIVDVLTTPPRDLPTIEALFPEGLRIRATYPDERTISGLAHSELELSADRFADLAEGGTFAVPPYLPAGTPTTEGFLFPKTYTFVEPGLTERDVIERMLEQFRREVEDLPWGNADRLGVSPYEVVIVASMVEREAKLNRERALIAGVIYHRLRLGMSLGIDATLLYDDPTPDGELSSADIATDTPYNTRVNAGLPPTPIASPGLASIRAALAPARTPYLFYVLCGADARPAQPQRRCLPRLSPAGSSRDPRTRSG
jgi:UPF0755 protein